MFETINIISIIKRHCVTLSKDTGSQIVFYILPFLLGCLPYYAFSISLASWLFQFFSIVLGFLINAMFSLGKRMAGAQHIQEGIATLVEETYAHATCGVVLCFMSIVCLGLFNVFSYDQNGHIDDYRHSQYVFIYLTHLILWICFMFVHILFTVIKKCDILHRCDAASGPHFR